MKIKQLLEQFEYSTPTTKTLLAIVAGVWLILLAAIAGSTFLLLESPGQAVPPSPGSGAPTITVEPGSGQIGTLLSVRGENWPAGETILLYLTTLTDTQTSGYAAASATVDGQGRFTVGFIFPPEARRSISISIYTWAL